MTIVYNIQILEIFMSVCWFSYFIHSLWYIANIITAQNTSFHCMYSNFQCSSTAFFSINQQVPKPLQKFVQSINNEFALWICFECTFTILWLYIFAVYQWDWLVVTKWVLTPDTLMHYFFQDFDTWWETKKVHHNVGCCPL